MPPIVIDVRAADDSRDVVHRAVQALAEGKLVAFPTETVYTVAASGLCQDAVGKLARLVPANGPLELAVKSADDAFDYVPDISPLGQRLARRCWPGPVTLMLDDACPDSLVQQLSQPVRDVVAPSGTLSLRVPAHETFLEVLRLIAGPVVCAPASLEGEVNALTAEDVVAQFGDHVQLVLDDGQSRYGQPSSVVRVGRRGFEVTRPGVVSAHTLQRLSSLMVLFVCTGNTCRSPMAEMLFRKLVAQKLGCKVAEVHDRGVVVASAGIAAMMGGRPAAEAVSTMALRGLDLTDHETQPLTDHLVHQADIVFAMTRSHRNAILSQWPEVAERTKLLSRDKLDVADPIGGPSELYERCAQQIATELEAWVRELDL